MTESPSLALPPRISRLKDIAYNLWWSWRPTARGMFKSIDRTLWRDTRHNPVKLLKLCRTKRLEEIAKDPVFLQAYDAVVAEFDAYIGAKNTWFQKAHPGAKGSVAYFSAEFGVHSSLPIYSGGLGILAGDHCKSASDLGVPLVGVGFMYPQGYVHQQIGLEGWQHNIYDHIDWHSSPIQPARLPDGSPCVVKLDLGGWRLAIAVWKVQVGRMPLYLMDTNVDSNEPGDREITGRLYGGDRVMRLRQEIVLGVGGVRVLRALGVDARMFHANEGHASFLLLERIRELVEKGRKFDDAVGEVAKSTLFTTHTPVPAGHDVFPEKLIEEYFKGYWPQLGVEKDRFLALARAEEKEGWNMTALALRLSGRTNGVSRRNGEVSRKMWQSLWPEEEVPITHVTNGVHLPTWVHQNLAQMYAKHLGADWRDRQDDAVMWDKVRAIPDEELWRVHLRCKKDLINLAREQVRERWMRDRIDPSQVIAGGALLDPEALTIGFARRFAGYKRASLIFRDLERLRRILMDPWRPVQVIFAGKAHPADDSGKQLIQQVYQLARDASFGGHIAFIEDYDMHKARYLVQGCDVWLNNPIFPLEACGTSGQKAAANGLPNLSIPDGWWEEAYDGKNGWAPAASEDADAEARDRADAENIYKLLEEKVVPLYYGHAAGEAPSGWVKLMKEAIATVAPVYNSDRMVKEYADRFYFAEDGERRDLRAAEAGRRTAKVA